MSRKDLFYEKPGIRLKSFEHFFNFTDQYYCLLLIILRIHHEFGTRIFENGW
jgi:hypothetical protein